VTKGGETLAVGTVPFTEVQRRLVAKADDKIRGCRIGSVVSHRDCAVAMLKAGILGEF
jgi:hypothetical protein